VAPPAPVALAPDDPVLGGVLAAVLPALEPALGVDAVLAEAVGFWPAFSLAMICRA
jgi:hypothetical protein